jgi:hypothetical protein
MGKNINDIRSALRDKGYWTLAMWAREHGYKYSEVTGAITHWTTLPNRENVLYRTTPEPRGKRREILQKLTNTLGFEFVPGITITITTEVIENEQVAG